MIIGEAPGHREDDSGTPFVGKSGQLLRSKLEGLGIDDVFITNAVSCRPPDNRTPTKGEIKACKKWLDYQIAMVKPKYVLTLGNVPLMSITGAAGVTKRRGKPFQQDGIIYLPTFHPSFILRDPTQEHVFDLDLQLFSDIIQFGGIPEERELDFTLVLDDDDVEEMLEDMVSSGTVSFDLETTGLYPWAKDAAVTAIGFGTRNHQWILPASHPESPWSRSQLESVIDEISEIIDDLVVVAHNAKFDLLWMRVIFGAEWPVDFDTMIAHYLVDENDRHGLKHLAQKFLGAPDWDIDLQSKKGAAPLKKLAKYHAHDLYYTLKLKPILSKLLKKEETQEVFNKIMMPCVRLFTEVEYDGVYIDISKFDEAENYLREQYQSAQVELLEWEPSLEGLQKWKPEIRDKFNWGSTQQLAWLLFDKLGIEVIEKTKTGNPSCNESVIKRIDHPCTGALLKFRAAKQQLSFFIDGWKPFLDRKPNGDYYLHPSFKLHGTVTGRLSCEHPNLQQVPRDPRIRSLISAPDGWTLMEFDLSQIELRIAAELASERAMLEAFSRGVDIHWLTALTEIERGGGLVELVLDTARKAKKDKSLDYSQAIEVLLEIGPDAATAINPEWKEYRKKAKAVNFGYIFGMWWKKFKMYARDNYNMVITDQEAQASRSTFFEKYSDLNGWHDRQRRFARRHGYVRSLSGRKRRLPAAMDRSDTPERREAERQAINSPVQSFANELNLMAALQLRREFGRNILRICGTVHDAVLARVRDSHLNQVYRRTLEIMSHPELLDELGIEIKVPIEAEGKVGPWSKGRKLDV
jgi:DNA polymerase-1